MLKSEQYFRCARETGLISRNEFWSSLLCRISLSASTLMIVSCAASVPLGPASEKSSSEQLFVQGGRSSAEASNTTKDSNQSAAPVGPGVDTKIASPQMAPVEVELVSIVSATNGRLGDEFKASNIYSLASGQDPFFNNLPNGTSITMNDWKYIRDQEKTISMSVQLKSYQRPKEGTERNKWWAAGVRPKVNQYTGQWAVGDTFCKAARDGYGEQWCFNYKVTKVSPVQ